MSSYLRSWLYGSQPSYSTPAGTRTEPVFAFEVSEPPSTDDEHDDDRTIAGENHNDDDDLPSAFPAINSAQRAASSSNRSDARNISNSVLSILSPNLDSRLMPPPPVPAKALRVPGVPQTSLSSLTVPTSTGSSLQLPPSTMKPPPNVNTKKRAREKVALQPGFGPLDWAKLKTSGEDLRGTTTLHRITPSELRTHNTKEDAWSAFYGKVYNITPYLPFHPGGEKELMRVAGRDGTKLFASTHAWVNVDYMLDACMVGFLIPEPAN